MNRERSITSRHFDRSEASREIFGDVIFISQFKDFSTTVEMTGDLKNTYIHTKKPSNTLIFTINY
ncbi:hypothetical protein [Pedobacter helvus]|uniref:Uncharacterized protein n=1 Tax=Pedobacter helvus TaxID=2563444 RepID=A0ABW9JJ21_9SPHI|nr:hypothetical protein [Pedobacter ureilyticus]